jgi:REP element-mobilizing transposase RayT
MNYFITFRTYGTWLHGDERGSVDRSHNQVGEPLIEANAGLHSYRRRSLNAPPVVMNEACRECVDETVREVAAHRGWAIIALCVLSNHVHVVVSMPDDVAPEKAMNDFKSYSTRRLRERSLAPPSMTIWTRHGSTRYLNSDKSVLDACNYVNAQLNEPRA